MKTIDELTKSVNDLINGKRKPASRIEDVFMIGYHHALYNKLFLDKYIELIGNEISYSDTDELHALCVGYGMGQKKLEEEIAEFELTEDEQTNH